jgi:hypothetical protein
MHATGHRAVRRVKPDQGMDAMRAGQTGAAEVARGGLQPQSPSQASLAVITTP